jgi:hypothetical protein
MAWKPKIPEGWAPFREGKWQWYEGLGFTWIGAESWGWLPYHYGRWMLQPSQGWIWAPGSRHAFQPGDVYWLRGSGLVGWGPLAPGEAWAGVGTPSLYLRATSTFARYSPSADLREIDPAGFTATPKDPLAAAMFLESLPSPRISRDRLAYERSDRPGVIRLSPNSPPPGFSRQSAPAESQPVTQAPPSPITRQLVQQTIFVPQMLPPPQPPPDDPILDTYYLAPVYTGIIVLNPPEKKPPPKLKKPATGVQTVTPPQPLEPAH